MRRRQRPYGSPAPLSWAKAPLQDAWECRARPDGTPCRHVNRTGVVYAGLLCCEACGRTRHASDERARREQP